MAANPGRRKISLTFPGGSLTASRGLLVALFGEDLVNEQQGVESTYTRQSHTRTRYPGGPATSVAGGSYTRRKYGTGRPVDAAGGEPIQMLVNGDWWTARLTGSHQAFCSWLETSTWASGQNALWRSEKGTPYGPFTGS